MSWKSATSYLVVYPRKSEESGEALHRSGPKRRPSHQTTEHELEVRIYC